MFKGGEGYKSSVRHYLESSTEISAGAVQPGSVADLCDILSPFGIWVFFVVVSYAPFQIKVIGKYRVKFGVSRSPLRPYEQSSNKQTIYL